MHLDPSLLRAISLGLIVVIFIGTRFTTGSVTQTPDGPAFGIKPVILLTRVVIVPVLIALVIYSWKTSNRLPPIWVPVLFFAVAIFLAAQMPGTIALTPTAVTQHFWFRPSKRILYNEVMAIQASQAGRFTRVLGDNRVKITHTSNHCAAQEFQQEIERRTGKRIVA
jgi:hypothetical protein